MLGFGAAVVGVCAQTGTAVSETASRTRRAGIYKGYSDWALVAPEYRYDGRMREATFSLAEACALLARTPQALDVWLRDLPAAWLECDEGPQTWSPHVVLGHLVEGERWDWIPRVEHILRHGESMVFPPFDRFSQLQRGLGSVHEELQRFGELRQQSLRALEGMQLTDEHLQLRGRHPEFGVVTLQQHLATWVAHDLTHVNQIARVMAKRLAATVGPWRQYLRVLQ